MQLSRDQFKRVLSLRDVEDWDAIPTEQRTVLAERLRGYTAQYPGITVIEGIRPEKQDNARWLYTRALKDVGAILGLTVSFDDAESLPLHEAVTAALGD